MSGVPEQIAAKLTDAEAKMILESDKCDSCGHLIVFHNYHCCTFCTVDDCLCDS